jgi:hypothetical protein
VAHTVVSNHSIRTLDALHVATAVIACRRARRHGTSFQFCTADRRQAGVAEAVFSGRLVTFVPPV